MNQLKDVDISYWSCLLSLSESKSFKEQVEIFRYFAHLDAVDSVNSLVQRFVNDCSSKLIANPLLTVEIYNLQCQWFVTPFIFQPPLFPCKNQDERKYYNELFKNWNPNSYCMDFYQKLKYALNIK